MSYELWLEIWINPRLCYLTGHSSLKCPRCTEVYPLHRMVFIHDALAHHVAEGGSYRCPVWSCGEQMASTECGPFSAHLHSHNRTILCTKCSVWLPTKKDLPKHPCQPPTVPSMEVENVEIPASGLFKFCLRVRCRGYKKKFV